MDYAQLESQAFTHKPKLIICGASSYSRDWDYKRIREIADQVGALVLADISHPSGLIARGLLSSPFPHCHVVSTTTHKTLRGPRGGMLLLGEDGENPLNIRTSKGKLRKMSALLNSAVFPGTQGGPLEHVIAAKAVALAEAGSPSFGAYAQAVCRNAKALSKALQSLGYEIVSGGTDNHIVLVDLSKTSKSGFEAEELLSKAAITVNKNLIPYDTRSPQETSGIRLGTAAITTRGLDEGDMERLAHYMHEVLGMGADEKRLRALREEVVSWMRPYPIFA